MNMKEFSDILKELRKSRNLSQEELGELVHVSRSSIAKYENGLGLPSEDVIILLCNYFQIERDELFPKENNEQIIVIKNNTIKKQKNTIKISFLLFVILLIINLVLSHFKFTSTNGHLDVISGKKINEIASEKINYFTIEDYQFGYINVYKNDQDEIILSPGGQLWSLNGLPDYLMGYYNGENIYLYLYINGLESIKMDCSIINNQGKYCYNTSKYKNEGYNFLIFNSTSNDINIGQIEFWC